MEREIEMSFAFIADCKNDNGIELYMESMENYFMEVTKSLIMAGVMDEPEVEFFWEVRKPEEPTEPIEPEEPTAASDRKNGLEIPKNVCYQIDQLVDEMRLAVRTPLLKHDPTTQGLYNGMEQIKALLDGREPDLVDSDGNLESVKRKK